MTNVSFDKIREIINKSSSIAIAGHVNPDGDAIGACCAMALSLKMSGKLVYILLESFSDKYKYVKGQELIILEDKYKDINPELFISLDCGDKQRLSNAAFVFDKAIKTINIDHHKSNSFFADFNYVDENASSTSEIVFDIINRKYPVDTDIASNIYGGILYDTGGFRHTSTTSKTMNIVSILMEYGIPFTDIYDYLFQQRSFQELKVMAKALANAKEELNGEIVYTTLSLEEIKSANATPKELDGIAAYIKSVKTSKIAVFLYEKSKNEIKASFRSENAVDVCSIAKEFGGGGHVKAAGCSLNMELIEAVKVIMEKIIFVLQKGE